MALLPAWTLCLLAAAAGASAPSGEAEELMRRLNRRLAAGDAGHDAAAMRAKVEALQAKLREVEERAKKEQEHLGNIVFSYEAGEDPAKFERTRLEIRERAAKLLDEIQAYRHEYSAVSRDFALEAFTSFVKGVKDSKLPSKTGSDVTLALQVDQDHSRLREIAQAVSEAVAREQAAYNVAVRAFRTRRRMAWGLLAFSAASALGLGAWVRRRRALGGAAEQVQLPGPLPAALSYAADSVQPGVVLGGNYRVEAELGRGTSGIVLKAEDLALKRSVAIKRLRQYARGDSKEIDRFMHEAQVVAGLRHAHIVQIHTAFREGDDVFLVFEHVQGRPLSDLLQEGPPMEWGAVKAVLSQVAQALDHAHAQRVIHCDLKPSNIMIEPGPVAKVMDFGLAHQAKATAAR